ncbi:LysR family transcriptional regulator [Lysinibacillus sp. 2017]|uniref:LysR family transcriptional regulator n=1 Tax=unclassified Lysinibacillus TaxID=2636778 RepID=UPI000D528AA8|nr:MULTISPECIES: LysR family transcriptional regulator [unclassified Lysinibacillus]AWE07224.1 LysR family transcriptional regulator [Lysinibacillus sp. 2017]TGN34681.1 LysR family transcriptional regulator [Lysinibacillus sp. S2017]
MKLEQFYYVREILQTKSITIASENLHVTQSAISQSITSLEKEVGIPLFHRSRQGTIPTEEGKTILYKILEILNKMDELNLEMQSIQSSYKGEINIATIPSIFMTFLPGILSRFQKDYPHIKVNIHEMENLETLNALQHEKIDMGFIALFHDSNKKFNNQISFRPMQINGAFSAIVPKNSKLALKKFLTVQDIQDEYFILYDSQFYHEMMEEFQLEISELKVIFKTTNTEVIKRSVLEGIGISILSDLMLKNDPYMDSGEIIAVPFQFQWNNQIEFGTIHKQNSAHLRIIQKFLEYV